MDILIANNADVSAAQSAQAIRTLRRLAQSPMIFELDEKRAGNWDRFELRKLGFRLQRRKLGSLFELVPDLKEVAHAKNAAEETTYLKLMRRHERLRATIIALGS